MTLKNTLDTLDGIPADVAKEYIKGDDGKFHLDHEDRESVSNMSRARDNEKTQHAATKGKLREAQEKAEALETQIEELRTKGMTKDTAAEVERLTKLHTKELAKVTEQATKLKSGIEKSMLESTAKTLSKDLTGSDEILAPHVQKRLSVSFDKDVPEVIVLDPDGQPSSKTVAELRKEFSENKSFAGFIKGSQGSGGDRTSSTRVPGKTGAGGFDPNASPAERAAWHKSQGKVTEG